MSRKNYGRKKNRMMDFTLLKGLPHFFLVKLEGSLML